MNRSLKQTLLWTPRVVGIMFVLFLSLLALDIFGQGYNFWETVIGLFMHLIPSFVLIIAVILAWRWKWIGAVIFIGCAIFYVSIARGFPWSVYSLIAGIPFVVGILFLIGWIYRKEIRT